MTVVNLSTFRTQTDAMLSASDNELLQVRREHQIKAAIARYNEDLPRIQADDVTGDGGKYYVVTTALSSWEEGLSRITQIEYPAATIASDETPTYLEPEDWQDDFWADVSGTLTRHLFLPNHSPASTETMRVSYTAPYAWSAGNETIVISQDEHGFSLNDYIYIDTDDIWVSVSNTLSNLATHQVTTVTDSDTVTATDLSVDIPQGDFFAICCLAASFTCQALATKYSRTTDSSVALDAVDHISRAQEFSRRAQEFLDHYNEHLGLMGGDEASARAGMPAQEFVDWNTEPHWPSGRRWIFHSG